MVVGSSGTLSHRRHVQLGGISILLFTDVFGARSKTKARNAGAELVFLSVLLLYCARSLDLSRSTHNERFSTATSQVLALSMHHVLSLSS